MKQLKGKNMRSKIDLVEKALKQLGYDPVDPKQRFEDTRNEMEEIREYFGKKAKMPKAQSRIEAVQFHLGGYAEPGYSDSKSGVIALGNWNTVDKWNKKGTKRVGKPDVTMVLFSDVLAALDVKLEWSDEWGACYECGGLVRTKPDSYSWKQSYYEDENGFLCHNCAPKYAEDILKELEGKEEHCLTLSTIDPEKFGYVKLLDDLEHGWHPGQDADPKVIARNLREQGVGRFLFVLDSTGQFDLSFSTWVHESEVDKLKGKEIKTDGPSVSGGLQAMLKSVPLMLKPEGKGIVYTKITPDGATSRIVTPQEFVEGIKD